jgi:spore coat polysaccharide biosynthesis predicted glycosyltransferase SpsG
LDAIGRLSRQDLDVKVVVGGGYTQKLREEITTTLREFGGDSGVVEHNADLAEMMLWADLAITGDGLTKYETAVTGTPSIMVCRPDRRVKLNQDFAGIGSTIYLGYESPLEPVGLSTQIQDLIEDSNKRQDMSNKGKTLVDGKGLDRIISSIPRELLG